MSRFDEPMGGSPVISREGCEVLRARVFDRSFNGVSFDAHDSPVRSCHAIHTASSLPPLVSCAATLTVFARCGTERVQLQLHAKLVAIQTEACPAVRSTQPANTLHVLLCAIHTISHFHSGALETLVQMSGLPRVFVHALAFSSTPSHANAAEFSSTPSHAAAAAHDLCSFHHSPRVRQLSDSRCSAAQRCRTAPGSHGHQTTPR